jgi:hypothetical protein
MVFRPCNIARHRCCDGASLDAGGLLQSWLPKSPPLEPSSCQPGLLALLILVLGQLARVWEGGTSRRGWCYTAQRNLSISRRASRRSLGCSSIPRRDWFARCSLSLACGLPAAVGEEQVRQEPLLGEATDLGLLGRVQLVQPLARAGGSPRTLPSRRSTT